MKLIYIAAPYTAHSRERQRLNIEVAKHMGCLVAELGLSPLMPTVNSSDFNYLCTQSSWDFWIEATSKQLAVCDAVIFCQGWRNSTGCQAEMKQATEMGIPFFLDIQDLEQWMKDKEDGIIL